MQTKWGNGPQYKIINPKQLFYCNFFKIEKFTYQKLKNNFEQCNEIQCIEIQCD